MFRWLWRKLTGAPFEGGAGLDPQELCTHPDRRATSQHPDGRLEYWCPTCNDRWFGDGYGN